MSRSPKVRRQPVGIEMFSLAIIKDYEICQYIQKQRI